MNDIINFLTTKLTQKTFVICILNILLFTLLPTLTAFVISITVAIVVSDEVVDKYNKIILDYLNKE